MNSIFRAVYALAVLVTQKKTCIFTQAVYVILDFRHVKNEHLCSLKQDISINSIDKHIVKNDVKREVQCVSFNKSLAGMIDHTLLKSEATRQAIEKLCAEAKQYQFASVCVNPSYVKLCAQLLCNVNVKICSVIGFPLGATYSSAKAFEAEQAIKDGACEVDMVINVGMLKSGDYDYVKQDILAVVTTAHRSGALTKVIIETGLLTDEEKIKVCEIVKHAGADFVKTSTGFTKGKATTSDIALMQKVVGRKISVKASGGINTQKQALALIASGASRIGASASVKIVTEENAVSTSIY